MAVINVVPRLRILRHKLFKINLLRKFEPVVDFNHRIALHIVVETLELQMEHRREAVEDDTLLGVLQAETLGGIFVLAFHHFDADVVREGLGKIPESFDVELNI